MCYDRDPDPLTLSDIGHFLASLAGILAIVATVSWFTAAIYERPSIEYQLHKSELVNWGFGS